MHNLKRQTGGLHSIQSDLHSEGGMTGRHAYQLGTSVPTEHFTENRGDPCHITAGNLHPDLSKLKINPVTDRARSCMVTSQTSVELLSPFLLGFPDARRVYSISKYNLPPLATLG